MSLISSIKVPFKGMRCPSSPANCAQEHIWDVNSSLRAGPYSTRSKAHGSNPSMSIPGQHHSWGHGASLDLSPGSGNVT